MNRGLQTTPFTPADGMNARRCSRSAVSLGGWRRLTAECRLAAVEETLARSGIQDGYPLAL